MNQTSIKSNFFTLIIALFFTLTAAAIWVQAQKTFTVARTDDRNKLTCAAGDCSSLNSFLALGASSQKNDTALTNAPEAVITVSTTNDVVDAGTCGSLTVAGLTASAGSDGKISLREAVCATNNTVGADTITLPNGTYLLTLTGINEDAAATGDLDITDNLTINGGGMNTTIIDGNGTDRVFHVTSVGNLTLDGLTVTNGNPLSTLYGGGIYNYGGSLTITNSIVSGNTASYYGGGIYNYGIAMLTNTTVNGNNMASSGAGIYNTSGTLSLTNSIVSGNTASESGGGIFNSTSSTATLTNSTVSGNTATNSNGGGIYNNDSLTITNSTVSGNTATINGGGIYNDSQNLALNLTSVTIAYNNASHFGGGVFSNGTASLRNTIVAKNTGNTNSPDYGGSIASSSTFNLIGNSGTSGVSGITNGNGGNQVGTSASPIDPLLDPTLALNGGTTPNHALLANSPAIDKGSDTGTDQRGFTRPVDLPSYSNSTAAGANAADIGAYEAQTAPLGTTAATVSISGQVTTASGRGIMNVHLSLTDSNGQARTATTTSFGYYQFTDVEVGETYILAASGKHYTFSQPVQVLNVNEETNEVNFIADSEKRLRVF